jgi:hypothetical protein
MLELLCDVKDAAMEEYRRASEKFGAANNSPHESYAVILEEYQEAVESAAVFETLFEEYWRGVKGNGNGQHDRLETMVVFAVQAAAEWCQVAAMCYKAIQEKGGGGEGG